MPYLAFDLNDVDEFVFDILEDRLSIGRDAQNDIVIDNTYISGSHAEFVRKPDGMYELVDLKSSNGTFVNGKRIVRALVKVGDQIRFGQLDASFRERAPEATTLASVSQIKLETATSDGFNGDKETLPARDREAKAESSFLEAERSFLILRESIGVSAGSLPAADHSPAKLDPAMLKRRHKLAAEVSRLRQERDLLRSETEKLARLKDEVRAMESTLSERLNELAAADARLDATRAATMDHANRYAIINSSADARLAESRAAIATAEAESEKLASKKRELANLDCQIESSRTLLSQVQADIETANAAYQSLQIDANRACDDRLKAEEHLAGLRVQIQDHEAKSSELDKIFCTDQKQKQSDLATLDAQIDAQQAEKEHLDKTLVELRQQNERLHDQAADLRNKIEELALVELKLGDATMALEKAESIKTELTAAISLMAVERDSLALEILSSAEKSRAQNTLLQTLTAHLETVDIQLRAGEEQQRSLATEIGKAQESLQATESTLESRKRELVTAESRAAQFAQQAEEYLLRQTQIQQEIEQLSKEVAKGLAELQQIRSDTQEAIKEAANAEEAYARHGSQAADMQTQVVSLEASLATLLASEVERQTRLQALEAELRRCEDGLSLRRLEASEADARLAELKAQTARYESRVSELAYTESKLAETKAAWIAAAQEVESLRMEAVHLQTERADHEQRLPVLRAELFNAQTEIKAHFSELETSQARAKELAERVSALQSREEQLLQTEVRLEEVHRGLNHQMTERDRLSSLVQSLLSQREEHENLLPKLRDDVQALKTEVQILTQDKESMMAALERAQTDRQAALEQTESLRADSASLQERLTETRGALEAEAKTRLAETHQAEARLLDISAKVAASEKLVSELAVAQQQLCECQNALAETEARRRAEETALTELLTKQDGLRRELSTLEDGIRVGTDQVNSLTQLIKFKEARAADACARLEEATNALHATETSRSEVEAAMAQIRDEENALRKAMPALSTELAGRQAALSQVTRELEEAWQSITRLNISEDESHKRISSLQQQISQLEETQHMHEERAMKARAEADLETERLKTSQEKTRAAERSLQDIESEVKDMRIEVDTTRTQLAGLESDLRARLDHIENLKLEEDRLLDEVAARQSTIASAESILEELREKTQQEEMRIREFTHVGGQILSFSAALADLQTRLEETTRNLHEASERDFAMQIKINSLQETSNREAARVEEIRQERLRLENEFNTFNGTSQSQKDSIQDTEAEQRMSLF